MFIGVGKLDFLAVFIVCIALATGESAEKIPNSSIKDWWPSSSRSVIVLFFTLLQKTSLDSKNLISSGALSLNNSSTESYILSFTSEAYHFLIKIKKFNSRPKSIRFRRQMIKFVL